MGALSIRVEAEGVAITFSIADGRVAVEQTNSAILADTPPKPNGTRRSAPAPAMPAVSGRWSNCRAKCAAGR